MYLFYQNSTKKDEEGNGERWKAIKDSPQTRESLAKDQVQMVSMLAISSTQTDTDYETLKYRGDLYFDIDNEGDLDLSIASTIELIGKLESYGVYDYVIYLSGKKGFHVTVPARLFLTNPSAGVKWLPYIYGHMALHYFEVVGLDMSVYSGGKGRLWRQPNVQREDNGQYKVPVLKQDLLNMTAESYVKLASKPNFQLSQSLDNKELPFNAQLSSMFEDSAIIVRKEQEDKESYRFETSPELEMLSEVPGCIMKLVRGQDVKESANFNKAAMSLAGYLKSANRIGTETEAELVAELSSHNEFGSGTYKTERARKLHINGAIRRSRHDKSMGCNPAYVLSLIDRCGGCVVCNGTLDKRKKKDSATKNGPDKASDEDGLRHNVFEQGLSYVKSVGPKTVKPLTTFLIEPVSADIYFHHEHNGFRREALRCQIKYSTGIDGEYRTTGVTIEEDAWDSASLFKKQFSGIDNVAVTCSEDDLADLRHFIMSKHNDIDSSIRTQTVGLDVKKVPSGDKISNVLVYTEPGYTAAGNNVRVPLHYESDSRDLPVGYPRIHKAPDLNKDNKDDVLAVKRIFDINEEWVCATMVGWVCSTMLKPHIVSHYNEFPLLSLTGRPGTGKTWTASIMTDLAGCAYSQNYQPASANSTAAAVERFIASSTSTPRVLEEVNQPAFRNNPKLLETLKSCYNQLEVIKGASSGGSPGQNRIATRSVKMTGPVMYLSEQPMQDDALRQRSIEVMVTTALHGTTQNGEHIPRNLLDPRTLRTVDAFEWVTEHEQRDRLRGAGKAMVHEALNTNRQWVKEKLVHYAEVIRAARCHSRQKFGWRVILTGLDFYEKALLKQCGIDVSKEVEAAKLHIINRLLDESITDTGADNCNVDVFKFIATLAERSAIAEIKENQNKVILDRQYDYCKTDCELLIYIDTIWPTISQQARSSGINIKYGKVEQFLSATKVEDYYVSYAGGCLTLNLEKMKQSGINIDNFYTDDEFEDKANGV